MKAHRRRDPAVTSRMMAAVRNKDTRAELALRSRLWKAGCRFRKNVGALPGRPDIVFSGPRVAVFVDGDFWHGNAWRVRGLPSLADLFPTRTDWWVRKIEGNVARDAHVTRLLSEAGWTVLRCWESEVLFNPDGATRRVLEALREKGWSPKRSQAQQRRTGVLGEHGREEEEPC